MNMKIQDIILVFGRRKYIFAAYLFTWMDRSIYEKSRLYTRNEELRFVGVYF